MDHNLSKNIFSKKEELPEPSESQVKTVPVHQPTTSSSSNINNSYRELKKKLHARLLDELDMSKLGDGVDNDNTRKQIVSLIETLLQEEGIPLASSDRNKLIGELTDDVLGLGPIEPLLRDAAINDVLVNGPKKVYVERKGVLELTNITFDDEAHLMRVINRIVSSVGRRVDESSPMVDARLKDGSRVNAIILPLSIDGATLSIRKFSAKKLALDDLVTFGALTENMCEMLKICVKCRMNILVSGGTGSGKTTFLNALSNFIPATERVVTIEDAAELQLQGEHVVRLETRPPNLEGKGEVAQRDLVKNALRMRPERIILGEIRSGEALDLLQAMNTGHDGSMGTLHANSTRDAFSRLETMCLMSGLELPQRAIREQIASAVHLICQLNRFADGSRRITQISEITGMENGIISTQDVFVFEQKGVDEKGKVKGIFKPSGIRPKFSAKLEAMGCKLPSNMFNPV